MLLGLSSTFNSSCICATNVYVRADKCHIEFGFSVRCLQLSCICLHADNRWQLQHAADAQLDDEH
jgi:hypothetical protein